MSVAGALQPSSPLRRAVRAGKQGIRPADRPRIEEARPHCLVDSLDLDAALEEEAPGENRWDYLIGGTHAGQTLLGVEVHPAYTGEVKVVVAKKKAAQAQLRAHLDAKARVREWIWIASGPTRITKTMPQWRLLTSEGIRLVGSKLVVG